ncbi:MAG: sigma-70 family RNA polymerase sigma factor [Acidobacteriota bacterium]
MTATDHHDEAGIATELVDRARAGDDQAAAEIFTRYQRGLLYLLRRWTGGDTELAEDLLQDTFGVVLERIREDGLGDPSRLAGFLHATARNLLRNARRKTLRRRTDADTDTIDTATDHRAGPLHSTLRTEEAQVVRQVIAELGTERDRQLLYRYYLAEEDKDAICSDLALDRVHFNRVLFRARQRFKTLWQSKWDRSAPGDSSMSREIGTRDLDHV